MTQSTDRISDLAFTLLRVVAGTMFALHGSQKLFGFPALGPELHGLMLAAGIIEFFGGVAITLGLLTRPVAFLCSGQMAFAYFIGHASGGFWPTLNHGELAVVYSFLWLYIAARGAGPHSLDARWLGRRR